MISTIELKDAVGITIKSVEWQISQLKKQGILKRIGSDKGGHWKVVRGIKGHIPLKEKKNLIRFWGN